MRNTTAARGTTLVELLVVVAMIAAICCLLMPAVQAAREAARRAQCQNNLKQVALALQSYEGSWNVFPPSPLTWPNGRANQNIISAVLSIHAQLLPGIDQTTTFNAINFQVSFASNNIASLTDPGINATAARTVISSFLCPTDPARTPEPYGPTNYRANVGNCGACAGRENYYNGAFNRRGTRPTDFTDGLSMTLSLSEKLIGGAPVGVYVPMRDWIVSPLDDPWTLKGADEWRQHCAGLSYSDSLPFVVYDGGRSWMIGYTWITGFTTAASPNSEIPDCGEWHNDGAGVYAARSYHAAGVQAAMADGSVRSVSNGIDVRVWRALGTRGNGELISDGSY